MSKAKKTTTGWRRRYLVNIYGVVWLVRGRGRKIDGKVHYMVRVSGKWGWYNVGQSTVVGGKWGWHNVGQSTVVDGVAQLAALRLQGIQVWDEPRW